MSVNTIELQAPYALRTGQNLLDQTPFMEAIDIMGGNDPIACQNLRRILLLSSKINLSKLDPDINVKNFQKIRFELQRLSIPPDSLKWLARLLDPYPDYLGYFRSEFGIAYDTNGSWIEKHLNGTKKGVMIEYGPMDTARSYGFWTSMRQRLPTADEEMDNTLTDADVTALLCRYRTTYRSGGKLIVEELPDKELARRHSILYSPRTWRIAVS